MLGLRRASLSLRGRVLNIRILNPVCADTEQTTQTRGHIRSLYSQPWPCLPLWYKVNGLSIISREDNEWERVSESEFYESEDMVSREWQNSALVRLIRFCDPSSVREALRYWVKEGKKIDRKEISLVFFALRKLRLFEKALKFSEWLEKSKTIEFLEEDYAFRVSLIGRRHGFVKAEQYFDKIPVSLRGELVYRTLLACCVHVSDSNKAEKIFEDMEHKFTLTEYACNLMILLYKRTDKSKIGDIVSLMVKNNIKPSVYTCKLLIDTKGRQGDIAGMEQILKIMKDEGIEPNISIKYVAAKHYISAGLIDNAEAFAKEIEWDRNLEAHQMAIQLYGELGRAEEVGRIWKIMCSNGKPQRAECMAAINAWGKVNDVEKAEAVFEKLLEVVRNPIPIHYHALLMVYVSHGMVEKGKRLVKQMKKSRLRAGPYTWDLLVRLYLRAGELGNAEFVLQRATANPRPLFVSFVAVMEQYSKIGDIHNVEKIFLQLKEAGYHPSYRQYEILIEAYKNSGTPLYGIAQRIKADKVSPSRWLSEKLEQINPFKTPLESDLQD